MKLASAFTKQNSAVKTRGSTSFSPEADESIARQKRQRVERSTPSITPERQTRYTAPRQVVEERCKIFNDPIHGSIELDELCLRIVDTPQYKRLHGLKQLGVCEHVYRSATHTRFEHSLGVAHLADQVATMISLHQPHLGITIEDIRCVKIAGLCHDLGHGPYSHVYDGVFIKRMHPHGINKNGDLWRHEDGSVKMFREILLKNSIDFHDFGLSDLDQLFIEEIIGGGEECDRRGRNMNKIFLYDIVNNTRSGLDVDKIDYFLRDSASTNVKAVNISVDRFFKNCRVMPVDFIDKNGKNESELMICYPEKMVYEALNFFQVRFNMHNLVYTHRSVKAVEYMLTDSLVLANDYILIEGTKTKKFPDGLYKMSECIYDMTALSHLKDSIVDIIKHDRNPKLQPAKDLLKRVDERKLYKCVGKTLFTRSCPIFRLLESEIEEEMLCIQIVGESEKKNVYEKDKEEFKISSSEKLMGIFDEENNESDDEDELGISSSSYFRLSKGENGIVKKTRATEICSQESTLSALHYNDPRLLRGDIIVEKMHIHYGLKEKNPVGRIRFFEKNDVDARGNIVDESIYESSMPRTFEEMSVRVFCKNPDKVTVARKIFEKWCKSKKVSEPFPSCSQPCETPRSNRGSQHSLSQTPVLSPTPCRQRR